MEGVVRFGIFVLEGATDSAETVAVDALRV